MTQSWLHAWLWREAVSAFQFVYGMQLSFLSLPVWFRFGSFSFELGLLGSCRWSASFSLLCMLCMLAFSVRKIQRAGPCTGPGALLSMHCQRIQMLLVANSTAPTPTTLDPAKQINQRLSRLLIFEFVEPIHGSFQGGLRHHLLPLPTQDLHRSIYFKESLLQASTRWHLLQYKLQTKPCQTYTKT